ncbi:hypothetical protein [Mesobacillus zeae]|nr:hypothetical protein [Mesobacillus zeae]
MRDDQKYNKEEQETENMIDLVRIINSNGNNSKISDIIKRNKSVNKKK